MTHLTVVYTINDEKSFESEKTRLLDLFKKSDGEPWAITAISKNHEMRRVDLIQDAINEGSIDLIEKILGASDIGNNSLLDDFRNGAYQKD